MRPKSKVSTDTERLSALQRITVRLVQTHQRSEILPRIVEEAMLLLNCDGGSIYLQNGEQLRFEFAYNRSLNAQFQTHDLSLSDDGIAVYSYRERKSLILDDVYELPRESPFRFNSKFDRLNRYRTRSLLAVPILNSQGDRIGVLQLINRKLDAESPWPSQNRDELKRMPNFEVRDIQLMESFASIAAATLENALLYENIKNIFEGFIRSSVRAIESRDPITKGHSERVARLSVALANASHQAGLYTFSADECRKIQYAALLHDFGKIGVSETVLQKSSKLYDHELSSLDQKFRQAHLEWQLRQTQSLLLDRLNQNLAPTQNQIDRLRTDSETVSGQFNQLWLQLTELNRPNVQHTDLKDLISSFEGMNHALSSQIGQEIVSTPIIERLTLSKGSLSNEERLAIESHVSWTYEFLKDIPWDKSLKDLPEITYAHHEKLDGSGYPRKLKAAKIPPQSRILTITDIYDALTSKDRPYKKALTSEKAISILDFEMKAGKLDKYLVELFCQKKVYEILEEIPSEDPFWKAA